MADLLSNDSGILRWIISGLGAFIIFLLGLGIRELSSRLTKLTDSSVTILSLKVFVEQVEKRLEKIERDCVERHREK
jgi:hypothetical protein